MLENPTVQEWLDKLQGRPRPSGGIRPGRPIAGQAEEALSGIVRPQPGAFGFRAPEINARFHPAPPAPNPAERPALGVAPPGPVSGGGHSLNYGGASLAAGLQKLGQGIEKAATGVKAKLDQQKEIAAMSNIPPLPPLRPMGSGFPVQAPPDRPGGLGIGVPTPPSRPIFSQPGVGPTGGTGSYAPLGGSPQATLDAAREAIAAIESRGSGDYAAVGPRTDSGDRAYGRYQVMGANVPSWTKAATGTEMTPEQFLADKAAQDAVFNDRFGGYLANGSVQDAASQWFTGKPQAQAGNVRDVTGTTAPQYLRNFNREFAAAGGQGSAPGNMMASSAPPPVPPARPDAGGGPGTETGIYGGQPYSYATPGGPNSATGFPGPSAAPSGAATVPVPAPPQPDLINGGQPGVYSAPDQQGMLAPPSQQDMLASALAQGQGQAPPPVDPGLLAMILGGGATPGYVGDAGGFATAPPPPSFDFGGGGDFGGGFGGFGGLFG